MTRRRLADPFVVAPPAKRVAKTRLRPSEADEEILLAVVRTRAASTTTTAGPWRDWGC